jgi:outer membrane protein assembly factor BamB
MGQAMRRTVVLSLIVLSSSHPAAENWPQWRGPGGQGISRETKLPAAWTPGKSIAW